MKNRTLSAVLFAFQVAAWFVAAASFWSVFKVSPQMALGLIPMVFYAFMGAWLIQILVQKVNIFDDSETLP